MTATSTLSYRFRQNFHNEGSRSCDIACVRAVLPELQCGLTRPAEPVMPARQSKSIHRGKKKSLAVGLPPSLADRHCILAITSRRHDCGTLLIGVAASTIIRPQPLNGRKLVPVTGWRNRGGDAAEDIWPIANRCCIRRMPQRRAQWRSPSIIHSSFPRARIFRQPVTLRETIPNRETTLIIPETGLKVARNRLRHMTAKPFRVRIRDPYVRPPAGSPPSFLAQSAWT